MNTTSIAKHKKNETGATNNASHHRWFIVAPIPAMIAPTHPNPAAIPPTISEMSAMAEYAIPVLGTFGGLSGKSWPQTEHRTSVWPMVALHFEQMAISHPLLLRLWFGGITTAFTGPRRTTLTSRPARPAAP